MNKLAALIGLAVAVISAAPAVAVDIQRVDTPGGLTAWLVESDALPMVSVQVAFRAGSAFDPEGQNGLAALTASLINEGAGDRDATAFQQALETIGARLGAGADTLNLTVSLQTLVEHDAKAFALLGDALTRPRFDEAAVTRMRQAMLSGLARGKEQPATVAARAFNAAMYPHHPYGQPTSGYEKTVAALKAADVRTFYRRNFTRENLAISVVGNISPQRLARLLDSAFEGLPEGRGRNFVAKAPPAPTPQVRRIDMAVPQSTVMMGLPGISRDDPDYFAAYAMNYVLGGGGFNSRLMEEVREKRGLAYSVHSYFEMLPHRGAFVAKVQTKNEDVATSIDIIENELARMVAEGVSEEEYDGAMKFLAGSFPLRLDSNNKILQYLTVMQMENLGRDYLDTWVDKVTAVTRDDMQRVARRLLHPDSLVTVIVGAAAIPSDAE